jgi:ribosomal protein S18 acetylase RimI-like enzyme
MDITFDYPDADELKFILDSWSSSFRKSPYAGVVPNNHWAAVSRASMTQIMTRPSVTTTVALAGYSAESRGRVMGYVVAEPGILHWIYVKKDFRKLSIGRELLDKAMENWDDIHRMHPRFTHRTDVSFRFLPVGWKWDAIPARVKA